MTDIWPRCSVCEARIDDQGEVCPRCLPLVDRSIRITPRQLLAERYALPLIAREAHPLGAAP